MYLARLIFIALIFMPAAQALDIERPDVKEFIEQMVDKYDYDRDALHAVLGDARTQESILEAISRPAERTKEWDEYRAIFLTEKRISAGAKFWNENQAALARVSEDTGVSPEMIVGIIGVETYFGRITGKYRVIDALTTLAFDYPPRSRFFTQELREFLLLIREEDMNAADATGSYAGAMGRPQFMPSSYRAYAVDSTGDGKRDIWENWEDVIGSVANYFVRHHWQRDNEVVVQAILSEQWNGKLPKNVLEPHSTVASLSRQGVMFATHMPAHHEAQLLTLKGKNGQENWVGFHNFFVITRYNRSVMYALAAHQLGQEIAIEANRELP